MTVGILSVILMIGMTLGFGGFMLNIFLRNWKIAFLFGTMVYLSIYGMFML